MISLSATLLSLLPVRFERAGAVNDVPAGPDSDDAAPVSLLLPLALTLMSTGFPLTECPFPFDRMAEAVPARPAVVPSFFAPAATTIDVLTLAPMLRSRRLSPALVRFFGTICDAWRSTAPGLAFAAIVRRSSPTSARLTSSAVLDRPERFLVRDSGALWTFVPRIVDRIGFDAGPAVRLPAFERPFGTTIFCPAALAFGGLAGAVFGAAFPAPVSRDECFPFAGFDPDFAFFAVRRGAGIAVLTSVSDPSTITHISGWADVFAAI